MLALYGSALAVIFGVVLYIVLVAVTIYSKTMFTLMFCINGKCEFSYQCSAIPERGQIIRKPGVLKDAEKFKVISTEFSSRNYIYVNIEKS